jgi:hypothetical protein
MTSLPTCYHKISEVKEKYIISYTKENDGMIFYGSNSISCLVKYINEAILMMMLIIMR